MRQAALALILLLMALSAQAQTRSETVLPSGWRVSGEGEMRWLGFRVYSARLFSSPATQWRADAAPAAEAAFALELTYARDIPGKNLVDASIDELMQLGWRDAARLQRWRNTLATVFPDVREGDRILGVRDPARGAVFYHQGQMTGTITDAELAQAFFTIWLDPRTREPGLRARLLGLS